MSDGPSGTIAKLAIIMSSVTAIVSSVMSVWVSHYFTTSRSKNEKLGDHRRISYGGILVELTKIERILDSMDVHPPPWPEQEYVTGPNDDMIREHIKSIFNLYVENYLMMSPEFIVLMDAFYNDPIWDPHDVDPDPAADWARHEAFAQKVRGLRPALLRQARSEMPLLQESWWARSARPFLAKRGDAACGPARLVLASLRARLRR